MRSCCARRSAPAAITGDCQCVDRTLVTSKAPNFLAGLHVPELENTAGGTRKGLLAVGGKGDGPHLARELADRACWGRGRWYRPGAGESLSPWPCPRAGSSDRHAAEPLADRIVLPSGAIATAPHGTGVPRETAHDRGPTASPTSRPCPRRISVSGFTRSSGTSMFIRSVSPSIDVDTRGWRVALLSSEARASELRRPQPARHRPARARPMSHRPRQSSRACS